MYITCTYSSLTNTSALLTPANHECLCVLRHEAIFRSTESFSVLSLDYTLQKHKPQLSNAWKVLHLELSLLIPVSRLRTQGNNGATLQVDRQDPTLHPTGTMNQRHAKGQREKRTHITERKPAGRDWRGDKSYRYSALQAAKTSDVNAAKTVT